MLEIGQELQINIAKTKTMVFGREEMENEINVGDQKVENVKECVYLGGLLTWDNGWKEEIKEDSKSKKELWQGSTIIIYGGANKLFTRPN